VLTQVLPLLGLLGTVTGMIKVFETINAFGTGNARGMSAGISEALITTMAGLTAALLGYFFASNLEWRAQRAVDDLNVDLPQPGRAKGRSSPIEGKRPPAASRPLVRPLDRPAGGAD